MIVTNVPGPPVPFYLLDARMTAAYPHLPLFENQGLGVALFSYAGTLYWGVGADWNQMPDLGEFMQEIAESFEELRAAAGVSADVAAHDAALAAAPAPRLAVHGGASITPTGGSAGGRGRAGRTRAASAVGGLRRALPAPRIERARSSRSTGRPSGPR